MEPLHVITTRPVKLTAPEFENACPDDCASWVGESCDCLNSRRRELEMERFAESDLKRDRRLR